MTKLEVQKRVLKNGEPLALHLFEWDEKTNTFSSKENGLVLDFKHISSCTFKTGPYCTFDTGSYCVFNTGSYCTFKTGSYCTFKTGPYCTFDTCYNCVFDTGSICTFKTGKNSVIIRRDVFEVIALTEETNNIRLNPYGIKGYEVISDKVKIIIDGKEVEISKESAKALKDSLCNKDL